jgi:hypothetical protein
VQPLLLGLSLLAAALFAVIGIVDYRGEPLISLFGLLLSGSVG